VEVLKGMKYFVAEKFLGKKLIGKTYKPLFSYFKDTELDLPAMPDGRQAQTGNKNNIWKIWNADFITLDTGTGIAHEAPAFGANDMELAKKNNIPVIKHISMDGRFTKEVTDFVGMKVKQVNDSQSADIEIIKYLAHAGLLFEKHKIIHSYPLCWRCKTPLLNYATSSWFVDVPKIKNKLLNENSKIGWTPKHVRDGRFGKWLEGAREWAVSRSRYWGAPLPIWKNEDGEIVIISSLLELAEKNKEKLKNNHYVMRHGEAMNNVNDFLDIKGDPNNHLTEKGKKEVKNQIEKLKSLNINRIIVSPFVRAKESANIVSVALGIKDVIVDERLRENNLGIYDGYTIEKYLEINGKLDFLRYNHRPVGGETHQEILNRMMSILFDEEKNNNGKNIL
jgi:isoleucyl-tRNA synthetase